MKTSINNLLTASTDEVLDHCKEELLKYYPRTAEGKAQVFFHNDDFVYAVGDSPITLVSHVDTVRDRQTTGKTIRASVGGEKPVVLQYNRNIVTNANGILGADDRAGVFGCLDLVRRCAKDNLPMPSVILCNGEESGGLGVGVFVTTEAFKRHDRGTRLFIEMDRCNGTEWVTYGARLPQPVIDYVESFGFRSGHGSYSDIADLQEAYQIPAVNLSIGYYGQHTASEKLHIDEMYLTIGRVFGMLRDPIDKLHTVGKKYTYVAPKHTPYQSQHNSGTNFERNNGGAGVSKNVSGGKENGANINVPFPPNKAGKVDFDIILDHITFGGYCMECGHHWEDCTCGSMLRQLLTFIEDKDIRFLMENYLVEVDPMYEQLDEYCKEVDADEIAAAAADKAAEIADPHHVGKEGEPLLLPGVVSTVKEEPAAE